MKTKKFLIALLIGVFSLVAIAEEDYSTWEVEEEFFQKENVQESEEHIMNQSSKTSEDLMEHEHMLIENKIEKKEKKSLKDHWDEFLSDFLD